MSYFPKTYYGSAGNMSSDSDDDLAPVPIPRSGAQTDSNGGRGDSKNVKGINEMLIHALAHAHEEGEGDEEPEVSRQQSRFEFIPWNESSFYPELS